MPNILPYRVEYALKNAFCTYCSKSIQKNEIQMTVMQQIQHDGFSWQPRWFHARCFLEIRQPPSENVIDGLANLRYIDQRKILSHFNALPNFIDVAMDDNEQNEINFNAESENGIDMTLEKQIKQQTDTFFSILDQLDPLKYEEYSKILSANNQFVPNDAKETLFHFADVMCFGALSPCSVCKNGKLIFRNSVYCCTGYYTAWSECHNTVKEPTRFTFQIPNGQKNPLKGDFNVQTRILRNVIELNDIDFESYVRQPLVGMEFFIITENEIRQKEIVKQIERLGGKVASKIHSRVAAVISDTKAVEAAGGHMNDAQLHGIQVVPEEFLDEVAIGNPIKLIAEKNISKWGRNPSERLSEWKPNRLIRFPNIGNVDQKWQMGNIFPELNLDNGESVHFNNGLKYNVMLNYVDIGSNKNEYFKLQLLRYQTGYMVVESNCRIGIVGSRKRTTLSTLESAKLLFKKIYLEKTGNEFRATQFIKRPGKFFKMDIDNESQDGNLPNKVPTKLTTPLYKLMGLLFQDNVMKKTLIEYCLDVDSLPLGKMSKRQIQNAMILLGEITIMLRNPNAQSQIIAASNQFYSYIPHDFGFLRPKIINTHELIQEKLNQLHTIMRKIDKFDTLTSERNTEKNLLDVCYEQLEESAEIKMLNKQSGMYTQICNYVINTQLEQGQTTQMPMNWLQAHNNPGGFEVDEIFTVTRHEELLRYEPYVENFNRQLLFHGTPIVNFVGILTNGLKIAPPEAHFSGSIFGKGIYFSDSALKSAGYCRSTNRTGLLLLCEVAAGRTDIRYRHDSKPLIHFCESVQALGQKYPHPLHVTHDGLKIPNGKLVRRPENTGTVFNEFVLFDESRVKIRYLVQLKFNRQH